MATRGGWKLPPEGVSVPSLGASSQSVDGAKASRDLQSYQLWTPGSLGIHQP